MQRLALGFALVWLTLVACESEPPKPTAATAPTSETAPAPSPAPVLPPAPADIDPEPYRKDLACTKRSTSDACRIVDEFAAAGPWTPSMPSGEGRWIGTAVKREKGQDRKETLLLFAKVMPTSQVSPGDLPLRMGFGSLPDDLRLNGEKLVRSLMRGDVPSRFNQALPVVEKFTPEVLRGAVKTAGKSVRLISEQPAHLRQVGRKVLIIQPAVAGSAAGGDGLYAELWLVTW